MEQKTRTMESIQTKALLQMYNCGDVHKHTIIAEVTTKVPGVFLKKEFTFYKLRESYKPRPETIERHKAFLKKKYGVHNPYDDEPLDKPDTACQL